MLSGSPAERGSIAQVVAALPEEVRGRVKVREARKDYLSSLKRLMSDVRDAEWVLTGETGPLHIAAKFRVRCYCLSGGGYDGVWAPWREYENTVYFQEKLSCYGCFGVCIHPGAPFRCLKELSAETVWRTVRSNMADAEKNAS